MEMKKILGLILDTGVALLESGAETHRVEDSLYRLSESYGFRRPNFWVVPSNIQASVMLPGEDGFSVVHRARAAGVSTPILFLTARDAVVDRVAGLDAGADDYLVKPFALDELMARVRVLARRKGNVAVNRLVLADLELDTAACRAWRGGKAIDLTAREYTLLEYLMRNHGIVLSRAQIESNLFNFDYLGASNVVDVYIRYLRRKVDDGFDQKLIHTVRGIGYVMRETP